jgi:hypothetical protein
VFAITMRDNPYDEIIDNIFVGSASALRDRNKFSLIVNCTRDVIVPKTDATIIRIPVDDDPLECDHFLLSIYETNVLRRIFFYYNLELPILIHCYSGSQRSCALLVCFLIGIFDMGIEDAIKLVKRRRLRAFDGEVRFLNMITKYNNIIGEYIN